MLPDRRGNNRIDSLRNIVRDPRIALLFLIPGVDRTLRINGRAAISIDRELCASFAMDGKVPRSVIVVTSNYHTRRARYIFLHVFPAQVQVRVSGSHDGDFDPDHWWQTRGSLKELTHEFVGMIPCLQIIVRVE